MNHVTMLNLTSKGIPLEVSPQAFGVLRDSSDALDNTALLRRRMAEEGYLLLRRFFDAQVVLEARREVLTWLDQEHALDPACPLMQGVLADPASTHRTPGADGFPLARHLLHAGRMRTLYRRLLGGEVASFDHTWMRLMTPGRATAPHCDIVFMGRGTHHLYTSWIPLGSVPMHHGPLMILEKSHLEHQKLATYRAMDIDKHNNHLKPSYRHGKLVRGGYYSLDPRATQQEFGLRWLTTDFQAGDVVLFTAYTVHATLDNVSDRIRLSVDTRYQLASEPVDERWKGPNAMGHHARKDYFLARMAVAFGQRVRSRLNGSNGTIGR